MDGTQQRNPWQEMRRLQRQMEHLFGGVSPQLRWSLTGEEPPVNVSREDNGVTLEALCPGVDRTTLEVTVVGDTVTLSGQRQQPADADQARYHRRERPFGSFTRTISVNERLDPDSADASYQHGVLSVRLRRAKESEPKKIAIKH
jgi:HSP20 family protein